MKKLSLTSFAAAVVLSGFAALPAMSATELTVYTAVEAEDLKKYAAEFNKVFDSGRSAARFAKKLAVQLGGLISGDNDKFIADLVGNFASFAL